jgi:hypothetical protein
MSSTTVICGEDHIFNAISERCITKESEFGNLLITIEKVLSTKGSSYFTRGCKPGTIKNPVTKYCIDMESNLGKIINSNLSRREKGALTCSHPLIFDKKKLKCVTPFHGNEKTCESFPARSENYEFIPHEEQEAITKWFINESPYRGIVLFHQLGSGKTCTSILMIDEWLKTHPDGHIYIYLPASLRQNFLYEYCVKCGKNLKDVENRFHFISYNYTSKDLHIPDSGQINGNMIIIDEFHKLILGMINQGFHYPYVYNSIYDSNPDKIICLTGTAITQSPLEIYYAVKMCNPNNRFGDGDKFIDSLELVGGVYMPKNKKKFKKRIYGVYSFLSPSATLEGMKGYPTVSNHIVYIPMVEKQYEIYKERRRKESESYPPNKNSKNYEEQRKFYYISVSMIRSRELCNMFYSSEEGLLLIQYAPKFDYMLHLIKRNDGKQVIYSQFKEKYGVYFMKNVLDDSQITTLDFTGDYNDSQRSIILSKWNSSDNLYGTNFRCLLITEAGVNGLNLFAVRVLHITEQTINPAIIAQVKGRVVRYGSHIELPESERNVSIIEYFAITPGPKIIYDTKIDDVGTDRETSDFYAYKIARRKTHGISYLLSLLKSVPLVPK